MNAFDETVAKHVDASEPEFTRRASAIEKALVATYQSMPEHEADKLVLASDAAEQMNVGTCLAIMRRCLNRLLSEKGC